MARGVWVGGSLPPPPGEGQPTVAGAQIADNTVSPVTTWSSQKTLEKIAQEIAAVEIPSPAAVINDSTTSTNAAWSSAKTLAAIAAAVSAAPPSSPPPPPAPPTPALVPTSGAATFLEDEAKSVDLATANVTLTGIGGASTTLPAGLTASVSGATLRVSGTPTVAAASGSYNIIATHAGGTLTFSLTLTVTAAGPGEPTGEWEFLKNENETFDLAEPMAVRFGIGTDWVEAIVPAGTGYTCGLPLIQQFNPGATDPKEMFVKQCEMSPLEEPEVPPVTSSAKLTAQRVETSYFDPNGYNVPYSQRAQLQALLDQHGSVNLLEAKDYDQDIVVKQGQKIHMIPHHTGLRSVTIQPGAYDWRVNGGYADILTFPPSSLVTRDGTISHLQARAYSVGGRLEDLTFINMQGQHFFDSSTAAGGWTRGCTWIKCWAQLAGIFQDQWGAQEAAFTLKGSVGRGDDRNVILGNQALNVWNDAVRIEGQKTVTMIGFDLESYFEPHNGRNARLNFANSGTVNFLAGGGNPFTGGFNTSADVTNIIHSKMNPFVTNGLPPPNEIVYPRPHVIVSTGAKSVNIWNSLQADPSYITDSTGGAAVVLATSTSGFLSRNAVAQAANAALGGMANTNAYSWLVPPAPAPAEKWLLVPKRAVADPLGPNWKATRAGKVDEGAAINAALVANDVVILEPRPYYISTRILRRRGKTLLGALNGGTSICALDDNMMMAGTDFMVENFNGGDNIIGINWYGGKHQIDFTEPQVQWFSGYIGYNTFADASVSAILLDKSYAWDHSFIEYNNYIRCPIARLQRIGEGPVNGPKEMYSDKTTAFREQYIGLTDVALDWSIFRSNNGMAEVESLFEDCANGAMRLMTGHNYMSFVNCRFVNNGGTIPIQTETDYSVTFVGGEFVAHAANVYAFEQGAVIEGMEFKRNGNTNVKIVNLDRDIFHSVSGFMTTIMNTTGDIPLGTEAEIEASKAAILAINNQFPVSCGRWSAPLSFTGYDTKGTVPFDDNTHTTALAYVQGPVIPGSRLLARTPVVGSSGGGGSTPPADDPNQLVGLNRFKATYTPGDAIVFLGDSTTQNAQAMFERLNSQIGAPGGELEGAIFVNQGYNGQTADLLLNAVDDVQSFNPVLVVICAGINDVRVGTDSTATLQSDLENLIEAVQAACPAADILLWTPNSFLTTDPDNTGTLQPPNMAQDYTNRVWDACNNIKVANPYAHVDYLDKQEIYGRTAPATSPFMENQLHPNSLGQYKQLEQLLDRIVPPVPAIDLSASAAAWASNPTNPWTVYSRALEDTRYCTLVRQWLVGVNMPFNGKRLVYVGRRREDAAPLNIESLATGDFIWTPQGVYTVTGSETKSNFGDGGSFQWQPDTFPTSTGGNARHYRKL